MTYKRHYIIGTGGMFPALGKKLSPLAAALALAACATTGSADLASDDFEDAEDAPQFAAMTEAEGPFPSTYRPYPGVATALVGATVFDGTGGKIENGTVLFRDSKVVAVGDASLSTEGYTVIDASGKFVTPGIIDIHSHLGDYPSPGVAAHSDGNEAT
ncbi:MAG: hypothetical protein AAFR64_12755, partial [Pseudomonadota bacterium]